MEKAGLGLLPLFAGLYDRNNPQAKHKFLPYIDEVAGKLEESGVRVLRSPVCVYENDIASAVEAFERDGADAVAVLFLAYHPSLESAGPLASAGLPLLMLDTTASYGFGPDGDPAAVASCHGIHGVQDLCCVLRRRGKGYKVMAGHYLESDVAARAGGYAKSARMASAFRSSRVGTIGGPFENMGDFALPARELKRLTGVETIPLTPRRAAELTESVTDGEIAREREANGNAFALDPEADEDCLAAAAKTGAVVRKWMKEESLNAFTFNFLAFLGDTGLPTVPFVAASKLMGEGMGYAGEGDVVTAALASSLMRIYPDTSFCEMFCPDWKGGTVYMSHMGEINVNVAERATLIRKNVAYLRALNGGIMPGVSARFKGGDAVLVNLAPHGNGRFTLILAPCEMLGVEGEDSFPLAVRGWLRPPMPVERFLEAYSGIGGTHHSCLVYGAELDVLESFGNLMNFTVEVVH